MEVSELNGIVWLIVTVRSVSLCSSLQPDSGPGESEAIKFDRANELSTFRFDAA